MGAGDRWSRENTQKQPPLTLSHSPTADNARNRFQTCVRWAIDAGAGIILPTVVMRGDDPQQLNVGEEKCLDAWWDLEHLDKTMAANCPQLKLRAACAARADDEVAIPPPEAPSIPPLKPPMRPYTGPRMAKGDFRDKVIMPALERFALSPVFPGHLGDLFCSVPTRWAWVSASH